MEHNTGDSPAADTGTERSAKPGRVGDSQAPQECSQAACRPGPARDQRRGWDAVTKSDQRTDDVWRAGTTLPPALRRVQSTGMRCRLQPAPVRNTEVSSC